MLTAAAVLLAIGATLAAVQAIGQSLQRRLPCRPTTIVIHRHGPHWRAHVRPKARRP